MIGSRRPGGRMPAGVRFVSRYWTALILAAASLAAVECGGRTTQPPNAPAGQTASLSMAQPTPHLDKPAYEPMFVETPDGTLLVTGFDFGSTSPKLWSSEDGGASWRGVDIGTEADGAIGNSDVDLAVDPDGTVYMAVMYFDRVDDEGAGIAVGVGRNRLADWSWTQLSQARFDDRPWIEAAPDGTVHVIWNDGLGVRYVVSRDQGRSWEKRPRIHSAGGSSHLAVGSRGEVAVRITPMSASGLRLDEDVDFIAVSIDAGFSWQLHTPPGKRDWTFPMDDSQGVPRWVEPVAWDKAGALYSLWSEGTTLRLGRSADLGCTWSTWEIVQGREVIYFPYLAANEAGELAATWFSGRGDELRANVALVTLDSASLHPNVTTAEPFQFDSYWKGDDGKLARDTAGEYMPVAFLKDGRLAVVTTIQDPATDRWGFTWRPVIR